MVLKNWQQNVPIRGFYFVIYTDFPEKSRLKLFSISTASCINGSLFPFEKLNPNNEYSDI